MPNPNIPQAIVTIIAWVLLRVGLPLDPEVEAALALVIGLVVSRAVPEREEKPALSGRPPVWRPED